MIVLGQVRQHGFEVEELLESIDRDVLPEAKKLANDLYKVQSVFRDYLKRRGLKRGSVGTQKIALTRNLGCEKGFCC